MRGLIIITWTSRICSLMLWHAWRLSIVKRICFRLRCCTVGVRGCWLVIRVIVVVLLGSVSWVFIGVWLIVRGHVLLTILVVGRYCQRIWIVCFQMVFFFLVRRVHVCAMLSILSIWLVLVLVVAVRYLFIFNYCLCCSCSVLVPKTMNLLLMETFTYYALLLKRHH